MATGPDSPGYQVALSALQSDAKVWGQPSTTTSGAQTAVAGETLTAAQFSYWAHGQGVTSSYTDVQNKMAALLGAAATNFQNISTTLTGVAAQYSAAENKIAGSFNKLKH